jgi:hypothetical protein
MAYKKTGLPPGPKPKMKGTVMKRGDSTQAMTYPRLDVKAAIVRHVNSKGIRYSGFVLLAALEKIARETGVQVRDLISSSSYEELMRVRGRSSDGY